MGFLNMRIVAAYLLAVLGGNDAPDKAAISKILDSVGIKAEDDKIDLLIGQLKDKNLDELIAAGTAKLSAVPSGGGGGGGGASAGASGSAAAAAPEPEPEEEEEEEADMGFSLFD